MTTVCTTARILSIGCALLLPSIALTPPTMGKDRDARRTVSQAPKVLDNSARAAPKKDDRASPPRVNSSHVKSVVYRPPRVGSPTPDHRIGGGTRGGVALPFVAVIAPDHEGLTARGQPELCWYVADTDPDLPIMFTLIEADAIRPLIERRLSPPTEPGIQIIRLADEGITLEAGLSYEWSVSIVPDSEHRSRDIVATGVIRRLARPQGLVTPVLSGSDRMYALRKSAKAGLWYDAVSVLAAMIEEAPDDRSLRREWAGLLQTVELSDPVLWLVEGL